MNNLTVRTITAEVASYYRVTTDDIYCTRRKRENIKYKHISMYFMKLFLNMTHSAIGAEFPGMNGRLDRVTVLQAIQSVNDQCDTDKIYNAEVEEIMARLEKISDDSRNEEVRRESAEEEIFMQPDFFTI